MNTVKPLLEVSDLTVEYASEAGPVRAVDQVSLELAPG
jgi:ABC-type glutathione transport system ATPase component